MILFVGFALSLDLYLLWFHHKSLNRQTLLSLYRREQGIGNQLVSWVSSSGVELVFKWSLKVYTFLPFSKTVLQRRKMLTSNICWKRTHDFKYLYEIEPQIIFLRKDIKSLFCVRCRRSWDRNLSENNSFDDNPVLLQFKLGETYWEKMRFIHEQFTSKHYWDSLGGNT